MLLGPLAFRKWRPDLEVHFADLIGPGVMYDYIYNCNMQEPTYVILYACRYKYNIVGFNFVGVKKLSVLCRVQQYGHVTQC